MSCFTCFSSKERKTRSMNKGELIDSSNHKDAIEAMTKTPEHPSMKNLPSPTANINRSTGNGNIAAQTFTFLELASATKNFHSDCLVGKGGLGRVYKGCLESTGKIVAIKLLDKKGFRGDKEFLADVLTLTLLHHPNLVSLIGYCSDGDRKLLVYEFMPQGSLEEHLLGLSQGRNHLNWSNRMRIATGAARGLEYLHVNANPPVIFGYLKSSNILLDDEFNPKLSDFGLAKLGPLRDDVHVSPHAPECARTGQVTMKSDVYSFGVVLLALITGKAAIDATKPMNEQNLVVWAQPMFKDQKRYHELVDPHLRGDYPVSALNQAIAVAAMCLQEEAALRPLMVDVVSALSFLLIDAFGSAGNPASATSSHSSQGDVELLFG